jgi:S1/P1 Nuclease
MVDILGEQILQCVAGDEPYSGVRAMVNARCTRDASPQQSTCRGEIECCYRCAMKPATLLFCASALLSASRPALAWGVLGHEIIAEIAYRHLTPTAKAKVDALLAADTDPLTAPDFASRATWADKYRNTHRETAAWHFVDIEIDRPDLDAACFGFPKLPAGVSASAGPAQDCVVNKIIEFAAELRNPATVAAERLLAFKFLLHFVGDVHQPLHASDHDDRGGNCIELNPSPDRHDRNLHAYWDNGAVEALGRRADTVAATLNSRITPAEMNQWEKGDARAWALESFQLSRKDAYALPARPACADHGSVALTAAYETAAVNDAALQLQKAGVRLAAALNQSLGT